MITYTKHTILSITTLKLYSLIEVLSGEELLNPRLHQEDMMLKKEHRPSSYRLACRTSIGPDSSQGGVIQVKLRPQSVIDNKPPIDIE